MRLILLLVLFTQITFSQRKPVEIFVDYVDQIEYVTFQLHFDSISKLNNINLIKEIPIALLSSIGMAKPI